MKILQVVGSSKHGCKVVQENHSNNPRKITITKRRKNKLKNLTLSDEIIEFSKEAKYLGIR